MQCCLIKSYRLSSAEFPVEADPREVTIHVAYLAALSRISHCLRKLYGSAQDRLLGCQRELRHQRDTVASLLLLFVIFALL